MTCLVVGTVVFRDKVGKSRMKYFIPFVSSLQGFHKGGRCRGSIPDVHY